MAQKPVRLRVNNFFMWRRVMKAFAWIFAGRRNAGNLNTEFARARLARTMPGEVGSMASLRLTGISL